MTKKMYDNLQEKHKINAFILNQILKIRKIITLGRLIILILIRQLGRAYTGLCNCLEIVWKQRFSLTSHTLNIQINSPTYSVSI